MSDKVIYGGVAVLTVGILLFAILYSNNNSNEGFATGSSSQQGSSGEASVNGATTPQENLAPDFTLENISGGTITLSDYIGEKPVILDFFATWCPNCQRDMPKLSKWYEKYKEQVEVIGIDLREDKDKVQNFVASRNISFPIVLDPNSQASRAYGIRYTNTHFLIDIDGNVVKEIPGDIKEFDILSLIQ